MRKKRLTILFIFTFVFTFFVEITNGKQQDPTMPQYFYPAESAAHEGTWLIWPHHYTYGIEYREELEDIWVEIVLALHTGEMVHIVAYNEQEKGRIHSLLMQEGIDMAKVDFAIAKSDDVWVRDTGPIFVYDANQILTVVDFSFDGWGKKTPWKNDNGIPQAIAAAKTFPLVSVPDFVLEGGSIELDGKGTAMLCKSSVISKNRNKGVTRDQAEAYIAQYFGVTNFIWLEGVVGEDITDAHIDGMARFIDENTLLTISESDFSELYFDMKMDDYKVLLSAKNADGQAYTMRILPMTKENVEGLDYKGSYLNYYIGNTVLLLPVYADENDSIAVDILAELYPDKKVIPIDVRALYAYGGMIHCVTQQQPHKMP